MSAIVREHVTLLPPVLLMLNEDGKIEAKCKDAATGKAMEIYIDPASGAIVDIKAEE